MSEYGVVMPLKANTVRQKTRDHLEALPPWARTVILDLLEEINRLDERIAEYDQHIHVMAQTDDRAGQLMKLKGVGKATATCTIATIGNGHDFDCGRQFAAWLGLTPGQYSSGGKARLGRITKAGDAYLRTLFILGARAVLGKRPAKPPSRFSNGRWHPAMRQQLADAAGRVGVQAREDVFEVGVGVVAVEFGRLHQAHDGGGALAGLVGAGK
jgi:transposase